MRYVILGTVGVLLVPLIAMQFTSEVNWDLFDFLVAGALLLGTGSLFVLLSQKFRGAQSRIILGCMLLLLLIVIWADLAVGIFNIPGFSGS